MRSLQSISFVQLSNFASGTNEQWPFFFYLLFYKTIHDSHVPLVHTLSISMVLQELS